MLEATSNSGDRTHSSSMNWAGRSLDFSNSAVAATTDGGNSNSPRSRSRASPASAQLRMPAPSALTHSFTVWVALSLEGRELHDLDAPKDA